jgi:hypothetical protein
MFAKFLGEYKTFNEVRDRETIISFLDNKRKSKEEDIEKNGLLHGMTIFGD